MAPQIHSTACIDAGARIGARTRIWHFCHVLPGARIGKDCILGQNVMVDRDVTIGNRCKIQNNVSIYRGVTLEDEVFCGPSCVFTNVYAPRAFVERKDEFLPTLVRRGATIGANATVICGVTIGRFAVLGAGALLREDMTDYAIHAGNPARQIGWACRCGQPLAGLAAGGQMACARCGSAYGLPLSGDRLDVLGQVIPC
jgi:UDP-2-acetamido-3-amino-2,3-dideoxy-glucuronate N-acetyltransferase